MGRSLGDLVAIIGADFSGFTDALSSVSESVGDAERIFTKAGAALTAAFTVPIIGFAAEAINAYGDSEKLMMGLTAVAGSADGAAKQMAALREVAKLPGLALDQAVQASIRLQSVGVSAEQSQRYLQAFGNAIALVGKGAPELDQALYQLSQSLSKGKVVMEDWKTIIEQVPQAAGAILAQYHTLDTQVLQKMGVTSQQLTETVVSALEKLPKATGGISNSFENLADDTKQTFATIGSIIAPMVSLAVSQFANLLSSVRGAVDWFKTLDPVVQMVGIGFVGLVAAVGPLLLTIAGLSSFFSTVSSGMTAGAKIIGLFAEQIAAAAVAVTTFAVELAATAAEAFAAFALETVPAAIAAIATFGMETIPAAIGALVAFGVEGIGPAIASMALWVMTSIPEALVAMGALIASAAAGTVSLLALAVEGIGAVIAAMAAAYTAAIPALLVGLEAIATIIAVVVAAFLAWKLLEWVANLQIVQDAIAAVKKGFSEFVDWVMKLPAVQAIVMAFGSAWTWVKGELSAAGAAAESAAKSAMKSATSFAAGLAPSLDTTSKSAAELKKKQDEAAAAAKKHQEAIDKQITAQDKAAKSINDLNVAAAAYNAKALKPLMDSYNQILTQMPDAFKTLGVAMTGPYDAQEKKAREAFDYIVSLQDRGMSNEREISEARVAMIQAHVNAEQAAGKTISDSDRVNLANAKAAAASYHQDLKTDAEQTADFIAAAFKTLGVKNIETARDELNKKTEAYGELVEAGALTTRQILTAEESLAKQGAQLQKDETGAITAEYHARVTAAEIAAGDTADIFKELGVKNVAVMQTTLAEHRADYEAMTAAGQLSAQQRLQAELQLAQEEADIQKATTGKISAELQARIDDLANKTGQATAKQKTAWADFGNQVSTIFTDLGKQIADVLFDGTGSFGSRMLTILDDVGKALARTFLEDGMKTLTKFVEDGIKNTIIGKGFKSITDALGGIFTSATSATTTTATTVATTAANTGGQVAQAGAGVAGAAGSAASTAGSLLSSIGSMANIANAVGSIGGAVLSIFQAKGAAKINENIQNIMSDVVAHLTDQGISLFFWTVAFPVWLDQSNKLGWIYEFMHTWQYDVISSTNLWMQALTNFTSGAQYSRLVDIITQLGWVNDRLTNLTAAVVNGSAGGAKTLQVILQGQSPTEVANVLMQELQSQGYVVRT